jgi:hypothetical protein
MWIQRIFLALAIVLYRFDIDRIYVLRLFPLTTFDSSILFVLHLILLSAEDLTVLVAHVSVSLPATTTTTFDLISTTFSFVVSARHDPQFSRFASA